MSESGASKSSSVPERTCPTDSEWEAETLTIKVEGLKDYDAAPWTKPLSQFNGEFVVAGIDGHDQGYYFNAILKEVPIPDFPGAPPNARLISRLSLICYYSAPTVIRDWEIWWYWYYSYQPYGGSWKQFVVDQPVGVLSGEFDWDPVSLGWPIPVSMNLKITISH